MCSSVVTILIKSLKPQLIENSVLRKEPCENIINWLAINSMISHKRCCWLSVSILMFTEHHHTIGNGALALPAMSSPLPQAQLIKMYVYCTVTYHVKLSGISHHSFSIHLSLKTQLPDRHVYLTSDSPIWLNACKGRGQVGLHDRPKVITMEIHNYSCQRVYCPAGTNLMAPSNNDRQSLVRTPLHPLYPFLGPFSWHALFIEANNSSTQNI